MRPVAVFATLFIATSLFAQSSQKATPAELQADAQRLVGLSAEIQSEIQAMKKFEISIKAIRKIDETQAVVRKMRATTVQAPSQSAR